MLQVQARGTLGELEPCRIDCSHYGSALGNLADDPFHCDMYYVCLSGFEWSPYSFPCPEGEQFDTVTKQCMADGYVCSDVCQKCSYSCSNPIISQASNFSSCGTYLKCDGGDGTLTVCPPENPYFDGSTCQSDVSKCCSCRPECSESDASNHLLLPDYANCTNFYLCVAPGIPDHTSNGHCTTGNFNAVTGSCDEAAPCNPTCSNGPTEGGCVDQLICEEVGYFPRCTDKCDPIYFYCTASDIGSSVPGIRCTNDYVVNPITVMCIPPEECPL